MGGGGRVVALGLACLCTGVDAKKSYAIVFDAGSTGTRVHTFSWTDNSNVTTNWMLPTITEEPAGLKVRPGLSTFVHKPKEATSYLKPLLELAGSVVPASERNHTVVLLRATAGMRLVDQKVADRLYATIFETIRAHGMFRRVQRDDVRTISGEDEGIFGWLAINYLLKRSHRIERIGEAAALDCGGGSTQITVAVNEAESEATPPSSHRGRGGGGASGALQPPLQTSPDEPLPAMARSRKLTLARSGSVVSLVQRSVQLPMGNVSVFTHSHLGFGNKAALGSLTAEEASACLLYGSHGEWQPLPRSPDYHRDNRQRHFIGKGDFEACDAGIRRHLMTLDRPDQQPILVGGGGEGGKQKKVIAVSFFFYSMHFAHATGYLKPSHSMPFAGASFSGGGGAEDESAPRPVTYLHAPGDLLDAAKRMCAESEPSLHAKVGMHPSAVGEPGARHHPYTPPAELRWRCYDAIYAARLLMDGFGVPEREPVVEFANEIDGMDADWPLGALISRLLKAHYNRLGSGQHGHGSSTSSAEKEESMNMPLPTTAR
jgi:hypothetical protein